MSVNLIFECDSCGVKVGVGRTCTAPSDWYVDDTDGMERGEHFCGDCVCGECDEPNNDCRNTCDCAKCDDCGEPLPCTCEEEEE